MITPLVFPDFLLDPIEKGLYDHFTWDEFLQDGLVILGAGLLCGVCGSKCIGWGWNAWIAMGIFLFGIPLMLFFGNFSSIVAMIMSPQGEKMLEL
jgi:hypothetical protein